MVGRTRDGERKAPEEARSRVGLWLLPMLVRGGLLRRFWANGDWPNRELGAALGIPKRVVHSGRSAGFAGELAALGAWLEDVERRFAVKVRFEPLRPDQRKRLLLATLAARGATASRVEPRDLAALDRLSALTPGDFAAVARRVDILAEPLTPSRFIAELAEEHSLKPGQGARAIGFAVSG